MAWRREAKVSARRSVPSIRIRPASRVAQPLQQGQRRGLAGAGGTDQGHGLAGLGGEGEVEHALVGAGEAVGEVLELDAAGDLAQDRGIRRVAHVAVGRQERRRRRPPSAPG